jgi:hypothetical protein
MPCKTKPLHIMSLMSVAGTIPNICCVKHGITVPEDTSYVDLYFCFDVIKYCTQIIFFKFLFSLCTWTCVYLWGWGLLGTCRSQYLDVDSNHDFSVLLFENFQIAAFGMHSVIQVSTKIAVVVNTSSFILVLSLKFVPNSHLTLSKKLWEKLTTYFPFTTYWGFNVTQAT